MPLKKIVFKPGINRENTRYTTEGGWYDGDKIRFRQGTPEKIGGWVRISSAVFLGTCRSLWNWVTLATLNLLGVGTNLKFYIEQGGIYNDITPLRDTATLTNPFTATASSATITVADTAHGCITGDFVTFTGATGLGGNITATVLNREYQVNVVDVDTYTFTAGEINSNDTILVDAQIIGTGGASTCVAHLNVDASAFTAADSKVCTTLHQYIYADMGNAGKCQLSGTYQDSDGIHVQAGQGAGTHSIEGALVLTLGAGVIGATSCKWRWKIYRFKSEL